jgi:hypothetical protein
MGMDCPGWMGSVAFRFTVAPNEEMGLRVRLTHPRLRVFLDFGCFAAGISPEDPNRDVVDHNF